MSAVTFTIEPDELLGLNALVTMSKVTDGDTGPATGEEAVTRARALLQSALAEKLTEAGLPWAPSAEPAGRHAAGAAEPAGAARRHPVRGQAASAVAAAGIIALWGGYARGWRWTGFQGNGQLWDWLTLLLPPVVTATVPLWLQYGKYIGRARTLLHATIAAALGGFVIAGYLIPLPWTGFQGQTLWNWFTLLMLPTAVACTVLLMGKRIGPATVLRSLRLHHRVIAAALAAGWVATVIGGYALHWSWTGYTGNTLWDWLKLLLLPLVFPTMLLPALLRWATGNAAERARHATAAPAAIEPAGEPVSEAAGEPEELVAGPMPA
jgi:hypothetical protein